MGKLIVIEGLDGSGKGTQAGELVKNLEARGSGCGRFLSPTMIPIPPHWLKCTLEAGLAATPGM